MTGGRRETEWLNFFSSPLLLPQTLSCPTSPVIMPRLLSPVFVEICHSTGSKPMVKRKDNLELGWAGDLHLPHREWPSVVWKALKQVAHDDPEHSSSRGAIEEMTSTKLVLSSCASFPARCTCAFLTTLIALLFISPSSGNLC